MKLESTTVPIELRSLGGCLDLAFAFYRHHARPLFAVTLLFALPAMLVSFCLAGAGGAAMFWALVFFFVAAPLQDALLVSVAGRAVFGEMPDMRSALRGLRAVARPFLVAFLTTRLLVLLAGLPCFGLSSVLVAAYYGFLPEVIVLEQLQGAAARRRLGELMRPTYVEMLIHRLALALFMAASVVALFMLVDQFCALLLGRPLFSGRIEPRFVGESLESLLADPWSMSLLTGTIWCVYPLVRLAWFFSYLDLRIRKEGWDLELGFRIESRRLEAGA